MHQSPTSHKNLKKIQIKFDSYHNFDPLAKPPEPKAKYPAVIIVPLKVLTFGNDLSQELAVFCQTGGC